MKYIAYLFGLLCAALAAPLSATPSQVIIIPNAEADTAGNLTQEGAERAGALPPYIISTPNFTSFGIPISVFAARPDTLNPFQTCIRTIAPTAQSLMLPIHSGFSQQQISQLVAFILNKANFNDKNVLICWPADTIPALAAAFGVSSPPNTMALNIAWLITFSPATLTIYPQDLLLSDSTANGGCGTIPYPSNSGYITPAPIIDSPDVWSFVSEPGLNPMKITVNTMQSGLASGLIFLAPYAFSEDALSGQPGALILDNEGNPFWFRPTNNQNLMNTDFRVQTLHGDPVLTFWQGTLVTPPVYTDEPGGSSEPGSCYYILDSSYQVINNIQAQSGFTSDIHEFLITPNNTALFLCTRKVPMDLTPYGGPQNGYVQNFAIQEVDIDTNELLFFWDALENIPLSDSYEPASSAESTDNIWDAYHFNSIGLTDVDTDIIVSSRNTWTIFRINKPTGDIVWRLGGKQSDFVFGNGAAFSWQHDARFLPTNVVSVFDDNCCESATVPPGTPPSHGLTLQLDLVNFTASLATAYYHDPLITVASQGNVETLPNGNKFVGWGQSQYYSEFAAAGNTAANPSLNLLYDAQMPQNNYTYRAYRCDWVGTPYYPPSIAVQAQGGQTTVYASWNGSTETVTWQVFAGDFPTNLNLITTATKSGFETAINVNSNGTCFQVKALDGSNNIIGVSSVLLLSE